MTHEVVYDDNNIMDDDDNIISENQPPSLDDSECKERGTIDYTYPDNYSGNEERNYGKVGMVDATAMGEESDELLRGSYLSRSIPDDTLEERTLSNDTFSFLIYAKGLSKPSLMAAFVFCLQGVIFGLVLADIIDLENKKNPLNFPPNVESTVRVTEVLAVAVAIITQDDVRKAINLMKDGYDNDIFRSRLGQDVSRSKWILSILLRGAGGLLGLFVTFLLIMQSETVLDLLLNFSAMEFVSLIDDVIFSLSNEGFFGYTMKREARALYNLKYQVALKRGTWKQSLLTSIYFAVLFAAMLIGWGVICANQISGQYLCSHIYLQFDDAMNPLLGMLSGMYHINKRFSADGRVTAHQASNYSGMMGYCKKEEIWTLHMMKEGVELDMCKDWVAASSKSTAFDITLTSSDQWYARTDAHRILPMDHSYIQCYDCKYEENFCGEYELYGNCWEDANTCNCTEGRFGRRCEFQEPCSVLEVDPRSQGFVGNRVFASRYYLVPDNFPFDRPVYTSDPSQHDLLNLSGTVDVISFTGRRWVVTSAGLPTPTDQFESTSFSTNQASFISSAVDFDGEVDIAPHPVGLEWFAVTEDNDRVDVTLMCGECNNETNPCRYEGICQADGFCECKHGATGTVCQIKPTGNGYCDDYFNNADYDFDGGDCCENTCVSTDKFVCGKDETGYVDFGYTKCTATDVDRSWVPSGNTVLGVYSAARSGTSVALGGSGGSILAVGDPGASAVRLFDKDGSKWIQRGEMLKGPPNSDFGYAISLSGESESVKKNSFSSPVVTLAIGAPKGGIVQVYRCLANGCVQIGSDITNQNSYAVIEFGRSVSLTKDGLMVAIGAEDGRYEAEIYKRADSEWILFGMPIPVSYLGRKLSAISSYEYPGYYVSLAGNGASIAIGTIKGTKQSYVVGDYASAYLDVQVYKWDEHIEEWGPVGDEISRTHYLFNTPRSIFPLKSIKLSQDATVLAIGSNYSAEVFAWDESSGSWLQRETDLNFTLSMGLVGWSIDLSADGSTLVIGTSLVSQNADDHGVVNVLKWNGTHYSSFQDLPAGEMSAISLSNDGSALAVGLPFNGNDGGETKVYKSNLQSRCGKGYKLLRLSFTTDGKPRETSWTLLQNGEEVISSEPYDDLPFTTFVEEFCVGLESCIKFMVIDSAGDGMNPPAVYSLMLDSQEVAQGGGKIGYGEIVHVGSNCDCPSGRSRLSIVTHSIGASPIEWALFYQNRTIASEDVFFGKIKNKIEIFDECIPERCWYLINRKCEFNYGYLGEPWFYNVTYNGTSKSDEGCNEFCPLVKLGNCWEYPNCNVSVPEYVGDWKCDGEQNNITECDWDGGDCLAEFDFNQKYPDCNGEWQEYIGNGYCNGGQYNTAECGWDGGDCDEFNQKYPDCNVSNPGLIEDDHCNGGQYNTAECSWDGGDCDEFNQKYPDCNATNPGDIGNDYCNGGQHNTAECGWDGGDCDEFNQKYPDCIVESVEYVGDDNCNGGKYNTAECGWDGGDCDGFNQKYPGCIVESVECVGDDCCDGGQYNTAECGWDGGDCDEFNQKYPDCIVESVEYVGDDYCNGGQYNTAECGWDGGDCDEFNQKYPDCNATNPGDIGNDYCNGGQHNTAECGWDGGDCDEFNQKYPDCNATYPEDIGNDICNGGQHNTAECGWDGGDCDEFNQKYPDCIVEMPEWVGDGACDEQQYNTAECGWDGGDC